MLGFVENIFQFDTRGFEHGFRIVRVVVTPLAHNPDYTAVDDEHGAGSAGGHAAVQSRPFYGDAPFRRLTDGVLLGMYSSYAVGGDGAVLVKHLLELVADFVAVGEARGRPHITRYQELVILGDDTARPAPVAGGPFGNSVADFHKVFIPGWAFVNRFRHICSLPCINNNLWLNYDYVSRFVQWAIQGVTMKSSSFLTVCMNPTLQKTLVFPSLIRDTVNRTGEYRLDASGKGINVSRVLTQLGKECRHLTQLGGVLRPLFLELCARDGLEVEWVESSSPVRFCYTIIEEAEKIVTELVEESERVGEGTGERLLEAFQALVRECSTLIVSGTKAAGFPDTLIPEMVRRAKAEGRRVVLDVRGQDLLYSLPFGPDIIKPNLFEFISTFAPELVSKNSISGGEADVKKTAGKIWAELYEKYPCRLVLTRGADSVWYAEKGELAEYTFESVEPLNTVGSGDAFTAGLAAALEEGASLKDAVAAGALCGKRNAALLRPGVIR